jgi:RNA polymerase sigma-70 factor (ECF subfamily)
VNSGSKNGKKVFNDWDDWLGQHAPGLLLYARQQTRCEADAQDVLQEAVVEVWQRQTGGGLPAPAFVYATVRRRAIDSSRSRDRRAVREATASAETPIVWFDPSLEERERARLIEESMRALPEIYREVVTLKIWGDLTFTEISETLEIPAGTAASRYRYGLEALRKTAKETLA